MTGQIKVEHRIDRDRLVLMLVDLISVERELIPDDAGAMKDAQNGVVHRNSRYLREVWQVLQILKRPAVICRNLRKERQSN